MVPLLNRSKFPPFSHTESASADVLMTCIIIIPLLQSKTLRNQPQKQKQKTLKWPRLSRDSLALAHVYIVHAKGIEEIFVWARRLLRVGQYVVVIETATRSVAAATRLRGSSSQGSCGGRLRRSCRDGFRCRSGGTVPSLLLWLGVKLEGVQGGLRLMCGRPGFSRIADWRGRPRRTCTGGGRGWRWLF